MFNRTARGWNSGRSSDHELTDSGIGSWRPRLRRLNIPALMFVSGLDMDLAGGAEGLMAWIIAICDFFWFGHMLMRDDKTNRAR
jgi:hypothetical protein